MCETLASGSETQLGVCGDSAGGGEDLGESWLLLGARVTLPNTKCSEAQNACQTTGRGQTSASAPGYSTTDCSVSQDQLFKPQDAAVGEFKPFERHLIRPENKIERWARNPN